MKRAIHVAFVWSVMAALALTSALKLHALSSEDPGLGRTDPVLTFLSTRRLMLAAALGELVVLGYLWPRRQSQSALEIIVWFAAVVSAYRVAAWASGATGPCPCMGHLAPVYDWVPRALLAAMFCGGLFLLGWTRTTGSQGR